MITNNNNTDTLHRFCLLLFVIIVISSTGHAVFWPRVMLIISNCVSTQGVEISETKLRTGLRKAGHYTLVSSTVCASDQQHGVRE